MLAGVEMEVMVDLVEIKKVLRFFQDLFGCVTKWSVHSPQGYISHRFFVSFPLKPTLTILFISYRS